MLIFDIPLAVWLIILVAIMIKIKYAKYEKRLSTIEYLASIISSAAIITIAAIYVAIPFTDYMQLTGFLHILSILVIALSAEDLMANVLAIASSKFTKDVMLTFITGLLKK